MKSQRNYHQNTIAKPERLRYNQHSEYHTAQHSKKAKPAKAGDAKLWVFCCNNNDCQAAEEALSVIESCFLKA